MAHGLKLLEPQGCYASSRSETSDHPEAMKASMLHKQGGPGPSPKHRAGAAAGGSPLHGQATAPGAAAAAAVEDDEVSDYTDADESISAPTEFLAEFLSAIMGKDYPTALKYCKLILQYEPNNRTAREFYPLIVEKLVQSTIDEACSDSEDDSSSGGSGSLTASDDDDSDLSDDDEDDDDDDGGDKDGRQGRRARREHNDNSSVEFGDTDGTTASYSSLEDEEADPADSADTATAINDNDDAGNGNEAPCDSDRVSSLLGPTGPTRYSDSESPTEPVSQRLITELRAKVVPAMANANANSAPYGGRR